MRCGSFLITAEPVLSAWNIEVVSPVTTDYSVVLCGHGRPPTVSRIGEAHAVDTKVPKFSLCLGETTRAAVVAHGIMLFPDKIPLHQLEQFMGCLLGLTVAVLVRPFRCHPR